MTFVIRAAETRDVDAAVEIVRDALAEHGMTFGVGSGTDEQLRALPASYTDRGGAFFVADDGGRVIGTAGVYPLEPNVFELRKMYLRKDARGRGVGAALFDACLAYCRARGARTVVLDTHDSMATAIAFYERRGFVRDDAQLRGPRCTRGYRLDL